MKPQEAHPWLTEFTNFFKWELSFSDIKGILESEVFSNESKIILVSRVQEVTFQEIQELVLGYWDEVGTYYLLNLIEKVKSLSYDEVEHILRNSDVHYSVKLHIISRIDSVQIQEIEDFINDDSINLQVRRRLAERIVYDFNVQEYLKESWYVGWMKSRSIDINRWQSNLIVGDILLPQVMQEVPEERTLNFYYREWQWAFRPHFEIFVRLLQDFIDWWNSEIWNNFRILHRWTWYDKTIWWLPTSSPTGTEFRSESSIYADTIHLTHGTPEKIPWTHAIVWKWLYRDSHKLKWVYYKKWQYSRIPLLYTKENPREGLWFPMHQEITDICGILLQSVQDAERRILANLKW